MKNRVIITVLLSILGIGQSIGQSVNTTQLTLDQEKAANTCFSKSKYYFKSFNRIGEKALPTLEETIEQKLVSTTNAEENNNYWMYKDWAYSVADESQADYTISGEYDYNSGITIGESLYFETLGKIRLPYFISTKENRADLELIFTFDYKDDSPNRKDTLCVHKKSISIPGNKFYRVEQLEAQLEGAIRTKINNYKELINGKEVQINFPKVKIKDKGLKAEYATINKLLKDGEYEKAGSIVKKVYEANKTPELSQALGICYELVGNYPQATEYYKALPDFHIRARMKKNMALLEQATAMGYVPEFIEF